MGVFDHRPAGSQKVYAAAPINRISGLTQRIIDRAGRIGVGGPRREPFRHLGGADDRSTVVEDLDQVILLNAALPGVLRIYFHNPVVIPIDEDPVVLHVIDVTVLPIGMGVEAESRVGGQQLQGIFFIKRRGVMPLPGWDVGIDDRPLRVVRVEAFQAGALEFDLAGLGLKPLLVFPRIVRG